MPFSRDRAQAAGRLQAAGKGGSVAFQKRISSETGADRSGPLRLTPLPPFGSRDRAQAAGRLQAAVQGGGDPAALGRDEGQGLENDKTKETPEGIVIAFKWLTEAQRLYVDDVSVGMCDMDLLVKRWSFLL
jgi:hypothetical protein